MIRGFFIENSPWIQITLASGYAVQRPYFILDTGFTGDLKVTPKIAMELGLKPTGVMPVQSFSGDVEYIQTAVAIVSMEGIANYVHILISDGHLLAGIGFLARFHYRALVNCHNGVIILQKMI